jgi:hypothetical protein
LSSTFKRGRLRTCRMGGSTSPSTGQLIVANGS